MNQILSTSMPENNGDNQYKNKVKQSSTNISKQLVDTKKVIKIFATILCVFAIVLISNGGYSIYKSMVGNTTEIIKPEISIENKSQESLLIKVTSKTGIAKVSYGWNDEEKIVIDGRGKKYAEEVINIPTGTNVLYVIAEDTNGETIESKKTYELDSNITIGNDNEDGTIIIKYEGNKQISYITYKWDEQEEVKIEINGEVLQQKIEAIKGIHTLTVSVFDTEGNKETKVQKIKGTAKPILTVEIDETNTYIVIKAADETALEKIEFKINDDENKEYRIRTTEKEFEYKIPLAIGINKLEVRAYNVDNILTKVIKELQ